MKKLALLLLTLLLPGCGELKFLENRVSCTLDGKQGYFCSNYGPLCVGAKIAPEDVAVMCKGPK